MLAGPDALPQPVSVSTFLDQSGVYILYCEGEIVYVGQSRHVPTRILRHVQDNRLIFDAVSVIYLPPEKLLEEEAKMIDRLFPRDNKTGARAEIQRILAEAEDRVAHEIALLDEWLDHSVDDSEKNIS